MYMSRPETLWNVDQHINDNTLNLLCKTCFEQEVKQTNLFSLVVHPPQHNTVMHENYAQHNPVCGTWLGSLGELFTKSVRNCKMTEIDISLCSSLSVQIFLLLNTHIHIHTYHTHTHIYIQP